MILRGRPRSGRQCLDPEAWTLNGMRIATCEWSLAVKLASATTDAALACAIAAIDLAEEICVRLTGR